MTEPKPDFAFTLQENAVDSLQHGLEHFLAPEATARDLKSTIVHVFHAVELFLKAALSEIHPTLIYTKIDDGRIRDDAHTVSFEKLLWRVQNFGIVLSEEDLRHLRALQGVRNAIEHHRVAGKRDQVEAYVVHAVRFLDSFLPAWLGIELKDLLDSTEYGDVRDRLYTYEERQRIARERLEKRLPPEDDFADATITECPECGEEFFWASDPFTGPDKGQCYFCDTVRFVTSCGRCGDAILGNTPFTEYNEPGLCTDCFDGLMARE